MSADFAGLRVLSLESRRAQEIATLIANCGGRPLVVSSVREVPLESNREGLDFARQLAEKRIDMVIFMTGVGVRLLLRVVETAYPREEFVASLSRIAVVTRGPKPTAALREMNVPISAIVPEPNTWRDLLALLDERPDALPLQGLRVALQEYGVLNKELTAGLEQRGAKVISVPVYEWALPEDTRPLREAVSSILGGEIDVFLATASVQVRHLFEVAEEMGLREKLRAAMARTFIASIGPLTSEELQRQRIPADMEPSHPKMGFLVKEAADKASAGLQKKSAAASMVPSSPGRGQQGLH